MTTLSGNVRVTGTLSAQTWNLAPNTVRNENVVPSAGIDATKVVHQHVLQYVQPEGADVADDEAPLYLFFAAADIVAVRVLPITAPDGGDKQFTVDVQKGNAGTPYASILDSAITVDDNADDRTPITGTLDGPQTAAAGDSLRVVIDASGSTGDQGDGVLVQVIVREQPEP